MDRSVDPWRLTLLRGSTRCCAARRDPREHQGPDHKLLHRRDSPLINDPRRWRTSLASVRLQVPWLGAVDARCCQSSTGAPSDRLTLGDEVDPAGSNVIGHMVMS